jgi:hypothetical protein
VSNLAYLFIALGLSVVLSVGMWLARFRKPKTFMSSIDDFRREMDALGGEGNESDRRRWNSRANGRPDPIIPAPEQGDLARRLKEARHQNSTDAYDRYDEER